MRSYISTRTLRAFVPTGLTAWVAVAATLATVVVAACDVHDVPSAPGALFSIVVTPNVTLAINNTQQFVAVGKDADGLVMAISPAWTVEAGGGAINSTGLFTAGATPGTFTSTVKAAVGGVSGTASVTVILGSLATMTVTPAPDTLTVSGTQQFVAVGKDLGGNTVTISPAWSVVAGGGSVNSTGLFTAGTVPGSFSNTVQATIGSITANATVVVLNGALASIVVTPNPDTLAPNATQQFAAVGKDASGNVVAFVPTWLVLQGGGAISSSGLFTAGAATGTFTNTVRASTSSVSGSATVVVASSALGVLASEGLMAGLSFTCITGGLISADIAISPGSTVTGFPPCVITGVQHLADGVALAAQNRLTVLYDSLALLPCPPANAIVADLGNTTKPAGVYCTAIGIGVTGPVTLDGGGDPNATFVFQAGSSLTTAGDVLLIGQAQAKNVYWQVGSSATLGVGSQWKGNIVALASITMNDGSILLGRALARNGSVSLKSNNTITLP